MSRGPTLPKQVVWGRTHFVSSQLSSHPHHLFITFIDVPFLTIMLCPICETLRDSMNLSGEKELGFHPTLSSLQSSSKTGCHLCRMVYTFFCQKHQSDLVSRNCKVLVKAVENSGFWVCFQSPPEAKSAIDLKGFDVAIVVGRLEVPSKSGCKVSSLLLGI